MIAKPNYEHIDKLNLDDEELVQLLELAGISPNVDNPKEKLCRILYKTEQGSDQVMLSPLAKRIHPDTLVEGWQRIFESSDKFMSDKLISLEAHNSTKIGPRSIAKPWKDRRAGVLEYFSADSKVAPIAKAEISKLFETRLAKPHSLRPLSYDNALKYVKNSTNSGLPFINRKGAVKPIYASWGDLLIARKDPCLLFTRTAEQGSTRAVFGYPMADTIAEMAYFRPLLEYQKQLKWRTALKTPEETDATIWRLIQLAIFKGWKVVSVDSSKFDASFKRTMQNFAFNYIKNLFQTRFDSEIDSLFERFNTIGIVTPDEILAGPGGIPSGSTLTNEVGSIGHALVIMALGLLDEWFSTQGDDGALIWPDPDEVFAWYEKCGFTVNRDKSYVFDDACIYLQRLYDIEHYREGRIGGIYPTYRALNRIMYPERFITFAEDTIDGRDYFSIRTIAILENCKYHPLFEDMVRYLVSVDKFALTYSKKGLSKFVKLTQNSKGSEGLIKNQYGEDLSGWDNFETVKLLRSM